jgi:hypothetical protein
LFDDFFKEVVYQGIANVTGASSAKAILFHVDFAKNSRNATKVHRALQAMLGDIGTNLVERSIIKHMFETLKDKAPLGYSANNFDFIKCVELARRIFDSRPSDRFLQK